MITVTLSREDGSVLWTHSFHDHGSAENIVKVRIEGGVVKADILGMGPFDAVIADEQFNLKIDRSE